MSLSHLCQPAGVVVAAVMLLHAPADGQIITNNITVTAPVPGLPLQT